MRHERLAACGKVLASQFREPFRHYSSYDFGRLRDENCLSVVMAEEKGREALPALRAQLPSGTVAFIGTSQWLGEERHGEGQIELVVGLGESQFDILRLARSDAVNYDMDTEQLIEKLQTYHASCGIDIYLAETDTVEFGLLRKPENMKAFAQDVYAFCPDIVDQGLETVEALAEAIEAHSAVHLWWD